MNREKLLKNMTDQVKEAQLKLGYAPETVRLYYPVASLNEILGTSARNAQEMLTLLNGDFEEKYLKEATLLTKGLAASSGVAVQQPCRAD